MSGRGWSSRWRKTGAVLAVLLITVLAACGSSAGSGPRLSLVAFSVPKPAYSDLQAKFSASADGSGTTWTSSYGASGEQARAVISGLPGRLFGFSLASDMTNLVDKNLVAKTWDSGPDHGVVSSSVVVIVVRKGNPKGIRGWPDLTGPGVGIVTPNPRSSGSGRWNVLAAWSQVTANGGSEAAAVGYLTKFYRNVLSLLASGREATSAFTSGTGDVLISYENEAIAARQSGAAVDYLVPDTTIKIENPGAVTTKAPGLAGKFLSYLHTADGQQVFAQRGFRPVNASVAPGTVEGANDPAHPFPPVRNLVTVAGLGGWTSVTRKFFDERSGIVTRIQDSSGVS